MKRHISLVLGSGGARGLAHIGVIRCLLDRGFDIRYVSGCSMGALVGGIYAAGHLDTFADWAMRLNRRSVVRLLDCRSGPARSSRASASSRSCARCSGTA